MKVIQVPTFLKGNVLHSSSPHSKKQLISSQELKLNPNKLMFDQLKSRKRYQSKYKDNFKPLLSTQSIFYKPQTHQQRAIFKNKKKKHHEKQVSCFNLMRNYNQHLKQPNTTPTPRFLLKKIQKQVTLTSLQNLQQKQSKQILCTTPTQSHYIINKAQVTQVQQLFFQKFPRKTKQEKLENQTVQSFNKNTKLQFLNNKQQKDSIFYQNSFNQYNQDSPFYSCKKYENKLKIFERNQKKEENIKNKKLSIDDFEKIKQLGIGHYGSVFLVRQKRSGFICALKQISKSKFKEQQICNQFTREIKIQFYLDYPNIVKLFGLFSDKNNIYLILECIIGGPLYQFLKKKILSEFESISVIKQICDSIYYLHNQKIIHRDIKPQNIVIHEGVIKLCDFGWSVYLGNDGLRNTFCGTPLYVSPQVLKGQQYDTKVDIWALGVLMYQILIGQCPFKIETQAQLTKIIYEQPLFPSKISISPLIANSIFQCLHKNPQKRPSIKQLLQYPMFQIYKEKIRTQKNIFQMV